MKDKNLAKERIEELFQHADQVFPNQKLANRYVSLARKIAMKFKTRIHKSRVIIYCNHCKKYIRIPLKNAKTK